MPCYECLVPRHNNVCIQYSLSPVWCITCLIYVLDWCFMQDSRIFPHTTATGIRVGGKLAEPHKKVTQLCMMLAGRPSYGEEGPVGPYLNKHWVYQGRRFSYNDTADGTWICACQQRFTTAQYTLTTIPFLVREIAGVFFIGTFHFLGKSSHFCVQLSYLGPFKINNTLYKITVY